MGLRAWRRWRAGAKQVAVVNTMEAAGVDCPARVGRRQGPAPGRKTPVSNRLRSRALRPSRPADDAAARCWRKEAAQRPMMMITASASRGAAPAEEGGVDVVLVGDSVGMVVQGSTRRRR